MMDSPGGAVEEDLPGHYLIVHNNAAVRAELSLDSAVVAQLAAGEVVHVLEVQPMPQANRVRGKLEHPSGWISLVELKEGYRWAVRQDGAPADPWALEKAQLGAELKRREAELQHWAGLAERLRAEYQHSLDITTELAAAVEDRALQGYRVPAWTANQRLPPVTPFAHSAKASEMQQMASKLGMASSQAVPRAAPAAPEEARDPAYRVPDGLPPGSKVVGFRRPKEPTPETHCRDAPMEGRVVPSNAILQPSRVHCAPRDDVHAAPGVYPIARPPVSMATANLLERPFAASEGQWYRSELKGDIERESSRQVPLLRLDRRRPTVWTQLPEPL
ncbi:unnamed protein product [Effrenium voratum]|nr:unnamed protein product [Effrenium voratum]